MTAYLISSFCFTTEVFLTYVRHQILDLPILRKCGSRIFKSLRCSTDPVIPLLRSLSSLAYGACLGFSLPQHCLARHQLHLLETDFRLARRKNILSAHLAAAAQCCGPSLVPEGVPYICNCRTGYVCLSHDLTWQISGFLL